MSLMVALSPAYAVRADAQQCYPDGRCIACVEYSGGVCTKCQRLRQCINRPVSARQCKRTPWIRGCNAPSQYFNADGTVDASNGRRWPRPPYRYRYRR